MELRYNDESDRAISSAAVELVKQFASWFSAEREVWVFETAHGHVVRLTLGNRTSRLLKSDLVFISGRADSIRAIELVRSELSIFL